MLILVSAGIFSCEEYQQGCMDASATNYKVSNQAPCCCEYPNIVFQTTFTDGDNTVSFSDTFVNQLGQQYLIQEFRFIASGITLTDSLDKVYRPVDTFNDYLIPPGLLATDVPGLNSPGANFLTNGSFGRLDFSIGRIEELENKVPGDFPLDHPFSDSSFYDFSRQSWVPAHIVIDVIDGNLLALDLPASELPVPVSIQGDWTKIRGKDLTVNFRININKLITGMDLSSSSNELVPLFRANFPLSFEP